MKSKTTEKPKTFKVTIIETLKREVIVHAGELKEPTVDDAEQSVRDWWNNGQIILGADDFTGVEFESEEISE